MAEEHPHYPSSEKRDADRVDQAERLLRAGRVDEATALLEQVVEQTPELYVYNFGDEPTMYVKFWSLPEYLGYMALTRKRGEKVEQEVIWLKAAYPRAWYLLGKRRVDTGETAGGRACFERALRLEPDHPECLLALAELDAEQTDAQDVLASFDRVLGSRPYMAGPTMARALAGKARQLIELGRYEEAETCLHESLRHGPNNRLALNVLRYAEAVSDGRVKAPVALDDVPGLDEPDEPVKPPTTPPPAPPADDEEQRHRHEKRKRSPWWKFWG